MKIIMRFKDKYEFLSNFHPCPIKIGRYTYPSVEHAFQASKSTNPRKRQEFCYEILTAGQAKKLGRKLTLRKDWESFKVVNMYRLVRQKFFNNEELAGKLLATENNVLIEGNNWGDSFWGRDITEHGENILGQILMLVRSELRAAIKEEK